MNNQTQHLSKRTPQTLRRKWVYFISNPEALCLRFLFKIYSKPATCNTHADTLKHFSLCVTHRVKWKEQTVSFTPVVPELLSDVRGGSPFILSPLNPTSRGPFPILVKEYVSVRMLTVQGLQRSIWAVRTSGKLPKSFRSPSIPQEIWESAAAKHMSLSHELGDHSHTTAAVHSSVCLFNSALYLFLFVPFCFSLFSLACCLPSFQGSHILSKPHGKFVCGEDLERCNHRGLSAGQMFRVSMQARMNSMPRRLSFSAVP